MLPMHHHGASSSERSPLYHIEAGGESAERSRQIISSRLAFRQYTKEITELNSCQQQPLTIIIMLSKRTLQICNVAGGYTHMPSESERRSDEGQVTADYCLHSDRSSTMPRWSICRLAIPHSYKCLDCLLCTGDRGLQIS